MKRKNMKKYVFFPHTADILFEAYGKTLDELFVNCALAVEATMVELKSVKAAVRKEIVVQEETVEKALYAFLEELLFIKDTDQLLFKECKVKIEKKKGYKLVAVCKGEKINPKKHRLLDDTKAITMHEFEVKQEKNGWKARIIVDV